MRHEGCAQILERLTAGSVIEMAVAVDDVFDRRLGYGLGGGRVGLGRPTQVDGVGGDHACGRDDDHRLIAAITENVDVVGDLGGCRWRRRGRGWRGSGSRRWRWRLCWRLLLSPCNQDARNKGCGYARVMKPLHDRPPTCSFDRRFSRTLRRRESSGGTGKILGGGMPPALARSVGNRLCPPVTPSGPKAFIRPAREINAIDLARL